VLDPAGNGVEFSPHAAPEQMLVQTAEAFFSRPPFPVCWKRLHAASARARNSNCIRRIYPALHTVASTNSDNVAPSLSTYTTSARNFGSTRS
jgi:hypothetical protein